MKTIVAHIGPDLDAIGAIWQIKTFFPGWEEAMVSFVPAGKTLGGKNPDTDPEILHVDTGFGKFDHHQTDADICASLLVYREIQAMHGDDPALERMVKVINEIDHFREAFFPDATADIWDMSFVSAIDGWRLIYSDNPEKVVSLAMDVFDGIYKTFQNKIWAEKELANGVLFESRWGKSIGLSTVNDEAMHLGQKMGFAIVVRKDPNKGYLRVKAIPKPEIDLTDEYNQLKTADPDATWFFHASRHMILNGSAKNPDMRATKLTLDQIIEILKRK